MCWNCWGPPSGPPDKFDPVASANAQFCRIHSTSTNATTEGTGESDPQVP